MSEPLEGFKPVPHGYVHGDIAQEMWCPEVRVLYADEDGSGAGINRRRDHSPEKIAKCIAWRCMAWRWWSQNDEFGYCGKFGKPGEPPVSEPDNG